MRFITKVRFVVVSFFAGLLLMGMMEAPVTNAGVKNYDYVGLAILLVGAALAFYVQCRIYMKEDHVAAREAKRIEKKKQKREARIQATADYNSWESRVVSVVKVDSGKQVVKTSTSSAIGRGVVGGALFGPVGAVVGGATAKKNVSSKPSKEHEFIVTYSDGVSEHLKVREDDRRFSYLISHSR